MAVDEVGRRHALFSLELHLEDFERARAAAHEEMTILRHNFSCRRGTLDGSRGSQVEVLAAETGVGARPGLKAAQAIQDLPGRELKINLSVFFLQNGRQRRF